MAWDVQAAATVLGRTGTEVQTWPVVCPRSSASQEQFGLAARAYTPSPWHRPGGMWARWCQAVQRLLLLEPGERRAEGEPAVF